MKKHALILAIAGAAVVLTGCVNPDGSQNNTGTGAIVGGAFGALVGAAAGGSRHGGADALIGSAAGALAGGLVGNVADQQRAAAEAPAPPPPVYAYSSSQTYTTTVAPGAPAPEPVPAPEPGPAPASTAPAAPSAAPQGPPLAIADVKALAKAGLNEDAIIDQIASSHTVFHLSASDIIDLKNSGVSDKVVNYMVNTPSTVDITTNTIPTMTTAAGVTDQAPAAPQVNMVVASPGPGYVWIDGEWIWNGARWYWVAAHWSYPPYSHAVWVVGRSWHDDYGWHNERGHWH